MPQYVFARLDDPSVKQDLFYSMKAVPSVGSIVTIDGVKWKRVLTKPQASFDTRADCHSSKDFVKATNKGKGSVGDLWDRAKEMSLKRKDKDGVDTFQQSYFKDYSRKRKGKKHPLQREQESVANAAKHGLKVDWGSDD